MAEKDIERRACKKAADAGWIHYKFTSPSRRGVPDRLFIKAGRHVFIEFKQPGKLPTELQLLEIERLRDEGAEVHVCDSVEGTLAVLAYPPA